MNKLLQIGFAAVLFTGIILVARRPNPEEDVRTVVEDVRAAALDGLNRHNPTALDKYFATIEEGAQANGLVETQEAYKQFIEQMRRRETVQFHSFKIEGVEVHESGGLARVTYRLHLSVLSGNAAVFSARLTQDLALLRTPRGWRLSGGDTPRLEEVTGIWPRG